MYCDKPIIGIAGGIGSGKSVIAAMFGEMGCCVIDSDAMVREAYKDPRVKQTLKKWWGDLIFESSGEIDRPAVWRKVVDHPTERRRLEQLLHPIVNEARERLMKQKAGDPQVIAFVWDTPLLFEVGLNVHCDAVVFVEAPAAVRTARVLRARLDGAGTGRTRKFADASGQEAGNIRSCGSQYCGRLGKRPRASQRSTFPNSRPIDG